MPLTATLDMWASQAQRLTSALGIMGLEAGRAATGLVGTMNRAEAEIQRRQVTRVGPQFQPVRTVFGLTGPGSQNLTEAEIQRRQVTRVGAEQGLVGKFDAIYSEINRRLFSRLEAGGVGTMNPTEVEIYRRLFSVTVRRV